VRSAARVALGALAIGLAIPAWAQDSGDAPPPVPAAAPAPGTGQAVEGRQVYSPADFARYSPKNAYDMILNLPGFQVRENETLRGMGQQTGNVLFTDTAALARRVERDEGIELRYLGDFHLTLESGHARTSDDGTGLDAIVLDDSCALPELVEEHGMGQRRCRPAPPAIDHLDDVVIVFLAERARDHSGLLRTGVHLNTPTAQG